MTRLIDADALTNRIEADKKQDNISPGNYFLFKAYIMNAPTIEPDGDLISRQDAINAIENTDCELTTKDWDELTGALKSLPSAPDSRQRGEWVCLEREENVYDLHGVPTWGVNYMCDKCGFITTAIQDHFGQYRWCPSCGADMRKGGDAE